MGIVGPNHWFREGDARFNPANIVIDSRNANFTAIIEKKTGSIVWRLGPYYPEIKRGAQVIPRPVDQISGQHDAHIIPDGLPGAGNLLLFDDQGDAGYPPARLGLLRGSRVLEINPIQKEIVWQYEASSSDSAVWSFYSSFISSARRLRNGNTLIDEGMNGRFFQITPDGQIVWEYINPYFGRSDSAGVRFVDGAQKAGRTQAVLTNWVYRATPVPYDWVPAGTPRSERAVTPPDITNFRVPGTSE